MKTLFTSLYFTSPGFSKVKSQSYVTTDSQSATLSWCQALIWDPWPIFPLLSLIIFRQLWVCWCGVPSLMRGQVCNLQCDDASSITSYIATNGLSEILIFQHSFNWVYRNAYAVQCTYDLPQLISFLPSQCLSVLLLVEGLSVNIKTYSECHSS
jgi:hypothetical protein